MWFSSNDPPKIHEADIAEKLNALHDLNAALRHSNIDITIADDERWLPFFTKLFRLLTILVIRQQSSPRAQSVQNNIWPT